MPHFLRFSRFRLAVAAYLANRSPFDITECLDFVDSHWLDVRTAWESGNRFQDCGNLLAAGIRMLTKKARAESAALQLALPFAPVQQSLAFSQPVALTPYALYPLVNILPAGCTTTRGQSGLQQLDRFLENPFRVFDIVGMFLQRRRVPFAARRVEEITTIDVDCGCNFVEWIGHRVNNRFA